MGQQPRVQYINSMVSGNLAYQPEREQSKRTRLPRQRRAVTYVFPVDVAAIAAILICIALLAGMLSGLGALQSAWAELWTLEDYTESLREENARLREEYASGYDPEEIQEIAEAMGYIPIEQAQHITITLSRPEPEPELSAWEQFCEFVAELFAYYPD
ncbi:MAG: hypothetical protein LUH51_07095 [Firmicutes bacterium]|nr:hypothetical protein [Bacillota bacterium]